MVIDIKHRGNGSVLFSMETTSLRKAVEGAIEAHMDLQGANLQGADLRDADLRGANLRDANLRGSDLQGVNLRDADLRDAYLRGADLRGANLRDADLRGSDLQGVNLRDADLTSIRDDLWAVLSAAPREVPGLRMALVDGHVDGSTYEGECACLVGTIAKIKGCKYKNLPILKPNSHRPAEWFFLCINEGDTVETSQFVRFAVDWIDEWLTNMRQAFGVIPHA